MGALQRLPEAPRHLIRGAGLVAVALVAVVLPGTGEVAAQSDRALDIDVSESYYDLRGSTLAEIIPELNGMRLEGPFGPPSQGLTRYRIDPEWRPAGAGGRCTVSALRLRVRIEITLPRWPALISAEGEDRLRWRDIYQAIRDHEYEHRDLTLEAARALRDDLEALDTGGCAALRQSVAGTISIAGSRLDAAHAELDGRGRGSS